MADITLKCQVLKFFFNIEAICILFKCQFTNDSQINKHNLYSLFTKKSICMNPFS